MQCCCRLVEKGAMMSAVGPSQVCGGREWIESWCFRWLTRPELEYGVGLALVEDDAGESLTIIVFLMLSVDECCLLGRGGRLVCYIYI